MAENTTPGLQVGADYGSYQLIRILGEGGGGQVWEADDSRSGRRVALKVLTELRAESPKALERFEQEGRLAASVTHPSCVFVFGAEEIEGRPTISMELMRGGTLRDRLNEGALEYRDAAASVLDIIEGLEAAQHVGIIHRDVKPSNCFLEEGGVRTKIGDFGVSRTLEVPSDLTVTGSFIGTPSYASPEQIRGGDLDFRSDMYSVGATLYELLTGQVPFPGPAMAAAAQILAEPPAAPSSVNPAVPKGLDRIVQRLMEKDPAKRFPSYAALRKAITPFTPGVLSVGGVLRRVSAYFLDFLVIGIWVTLILSSYAAYERAGPRLLAMGAQFSVEFLYYWVLETRWGASLGKRLLGMTVTSATGERLGARAVALRTFLYVGITNGPLTLARAVSVTPDLEADVWAAIGVAVLFLTMRARNGYSGIHDLLSNSRVVSISRTSTVGAPDRPLPAPEPADAVFPKMGPYVVESTLWHTPTARLLLAHDVDLDRLVWIHHYDDPKAGPALARLTHSTPGRLRWLQGSRSGSPYWDAYAVPSGSPLIAWVEERGHLSWVESRQILRGLAVELSQPDPELPSLLSPRHVWVSGTGEPKLLDFPVDATDREGPGVDPATSVPADFLRWMAVYTLEGRDDGGPAERSNGPRSPVPGHAHEFLRGLFARDVPSLGTLADQLGGLMLESPAVTRGRRGSAVLLGAFPFVFVAIIGLSIAALVFSTPTELDIFRTDDLIEEIYQPATAADASPDKRAAAEVLLINLKNLPDNQAVDSFLEGILASSQRDITRDDLVALIDSLAENRPPPTEQEVRAARQVLRLGENTEGRIAILTYMIALGPAVLGAIAVVLALLLRGGPMLGALGIQVRTADGSRAGRWRCAARTTLAWSPFFISMLVLTFAPNELGPTAVGVTLVLMLTWLVGLGLTLEKPLRGPHDRMAGTYLVPK